MWGLREKVFRYGKVRVWALVGTAVLLGAGFVAAMVERSTVSFPVLLLLAGVVVLQLHEGRSLRKVHEKLNRIQARLPSSAPQRAPARDDRTEELLAVFSRALSELAEQKIEQEAALARIRERAGHTNAQFEWIVEQLNTLGAGVVSE